MTPSSFVLALLAAALGSAVNSIAGGGTLVTFPMIVGLGVDPLVANATSTVALWPGAFGSLWGYRSELRGERAWVLGFALPSLVGGALGAWLLLATGEDRFARIVPFLVLGATVLFMLHGPLIRRLRGAGSGRPVPRAPSWGFMLAQILVGTYGGYFGAGAGILMLAVLGLVGLVNIHQMNGLKNWGGLCINLVAASFFAVNRIVIWPLALAMTVGSLVGGYGGARLAQRVEQAMVRRAVVVIGLAAFVWLLTRPV